ncbi:hypothetical protein QQ008_24575 [Fulvivirgaceae bacterium BMA10]|uniref:Uncharacterized protein n=1 Tax=Splendidivirga corallicola TaxID=3051826 RepID=A0ABT8KUZ0_9BACT|nr:hypothetical protein [Fulvivirgaceae bacterium BMA10]
MKKDLGPCLGMAFMGLGFVSKAWHESKMADGIKTSVCENSYKLGTPGKGLGARENDCFGTRKYPVAAKNNLGILSNDAGGAKNNPGIPKNDFGWGKNAGGVVSKDIGTQNNGSGMNFINFLIISKTTYNNETITDQPT